MSSKRLSPTASILRSSRLFSLPQPASREDTFFSRLVDVQRDSETATKIYPTHQAITTPAKSRARGDWGLKRSFPLRSTTRTVDTALRINAVDTREHITDFENANDHVISLNKFQEMGLPITNPEPITVNSLRRNVARSVFEPEYDNTHVQQTGNRPVGSTQEPRRWKYNGPWLAAMSEADFIEYISRSLKERRAEFQAYLREHICQRIQTARQRAALEEGTQYQPSQVEITEDDVTRELSSMRHDFDLNSDLGRLVARFLDLPGVGLAGQVGQRGSSAVEAFSAATGLASISRDIGRGPPSTHPSAGLSYLRTDAHLPNHPILGALARPHPQVARILQASPPPQNSTREIIGLGGFSATSLDYESPTPQLTNIQRVHALSEDDRQDTDDVSFQDREIVSGRNIGITLRGGYRFWVEPVRAMVHSSGRVILHVRPAASSNVDARTGRPNEVNGILPMTQAGSPRRAASAEQHFFKLSGFEANSNKSSSGGYGFNMPDAADEDPMANSREMSEDGAQRQDEDERWKEQVITEYAQSMQRDSELRNSDPSKS